jgi:uncharacterized membrane protein
MTHLIVIGYDQVSKADEAMAHVQQMAESDLIDIQTVCVVVRDRDGKTSYRTTVPLPDAGTGAVAGGLWGGLWGTLIGALLAPATAGGSAAAATVLASSAAGTTLGAGTGAVAGDLDRSDFDQSFKSQIELMLRPGTSALVALVDSYRADPDDLVKRIAPLGGRVLRTNLAPEAEAKLQSALSRAA